MRLSKFRVQNYKIIDDTGLIPVDPNVTALVGKNESGKTGILRAIWKSHNVAEAKFDKLLDYPRDRYAKERKGAQEIVSLVFDLSNADIAALGPHFPSQPSPRVEQVIFTVNYDGEDKTNRTITFGNDIEKSFLRNAAEARAAVEAVASAIHAILTKDEPVLAAARDLAMNKMSDTSPLWDQTVVGALNDFQNVVVQWRGQDAARASYAQAEIDALATILASARAGEPLAAARKWALDNLPTFIYFDDYGQLETRIYLPAYLTRRTTSDAKTRTQTALFEQASLDPQEILDLGKPKANGESDEQVQRRKDKRSALLASASFSLTGEWTEWWPEKLHQLHFEADGDDLVLRVSDEHNPFPIPFQERSQGFQWFFSFYLVFLVESKRAHKGAILLLDEPGLHLHPTLQSSLTEYFNRVSSENQLLYSTHLPFLVDGNRLDRVRTVHLSQSEPKKTVVSNDVRPAGDRDTLFPLQAAVGYSIAQTLFLGKRSVILEGITDYWLIKALNDAMSPRGVSDLLHPDTILIPTGGTSRLMPLASIMFGATGMEGKNLLVVLDSDKAGRDAMDRVKDTFGDDSRVMLLGTGIGMSEATIEDLLPRDAYVEAAKAALSKEFTLNRDEQSVTTNVVAIQKAFQRLGLGEFGIAEKAQVALKLVNIWGTDPKGIPAETIERARKLFAAVNSRF